MRRVSQLSGPPVKDHPRLAVDPEVANQYELLTRATPKHRLGPTRGLYRYWTSAADEEAALRYLGRTHGRFDLIHSHFFRRSRHLPRVARRLGIPFIVTEHDGRFTLEQPHPGFLNAYTRPQMKHVFSHAASVVCVSATLRDMLVHHGFQGNFAVVPNPIDVSRFQPRQHQPSEMSRVKLASVGRLVPEKGFDTLLHTLAIVANRDSKRSYELTIAGSGPLLSALCELRSELGLDQVVRFAGNLGRDEVADLLKGSDLFALPTRFESLGVVFVEAMACGVPVVATDVGPIPEIVPREAGVLAQGTKVPQFVLALEDAVARRSDFNRDLISRDARDRYSYERVGRMLKDIYEQASQTSIPT